MRAAARWGVPWTVLTGERAPGERWTERDTLLAAALEAHDADLCGGCGHPLAESTQEGARYEAPLPKRCLACDALAQRQEVYQNPDKTRRPQALHFSTRRLD